MLRMLFAIWTERESVGIVFGLRCLVDVLVDLVVVVVAEVVVDGGHRHMIDEVVVAIEAEATQGLHHHDVATLEALREAVQDPDLKSTPLPSVMHGKRFQMKDDPNIKQKAVSA